MSELAVQTFMVRSDLKKDLRGTLGKLMDLGIGSFELARMDFNEENAQAVKRLEDERGLKVSIIQVKPHLLDADFDSIVDFCKTVRCPAVCVSRMSLKAIFGGEEELAHFILFLNNLEKRYQKAGLTLAYHHHHWEFAALENGLTKMEMLYQGAEKLQFVTDTYWTAKAGQSPLRQISFLSNRLYGVHLRDIKALGHGLKIKTVNCELGQGFNDIPGIIHSAQKGGAKYLALEQKTSSPYKSLKASLDYLKDNNLFI